MTSFQFERWKQVGLKENMADNTGMGTHFQTKNKVYIERSLNTQPVKTYQESIKLKIAEEDAKKTRKSTFLRAISLLLDELLIRKVMTFEECFRFYSSYIKDITQLSESVIHNAKQSFQDKILGYGGLPVILIKTGNTRFFLLVENGVNDAICNGLQDIMESSIEQLQYTILNEHLKSLAIVYENLMSLASTNKDRYLLVYILSRMFSKTGLKNCLDLNPDFVDKVEGQVETLLWSVPDKIGEFEADAKKHVEETLSNLKQVINEKTEILNKRKKRLSENLILDYEYEIANKKQKLDTLQKDSVKFRKQYVYRKFRGWKCNILSQKGRKKGSYLIDREAETAIFNVLAENSKAHRRRHGEEGTVYMDEPSQRIQTREMLRIANQYLKRKKEAYQD
jgi:hypothetical protein